MQATLQGFGVQRLGLYIHMRQTALHTAAAVPYEGLTV